MGLHLIIFWPLPFFIELPTFLHCSPRVPEVHQIMWLCDVPGKSWMSQSRNGLSQKNAKENIWRQTEDNFHSFFFYIPMCPLVTSERNLKRIATLIYPFCLKKMANEKKIQETLKKNCWWWNVKFSVAIFIIDWYI